MLVAHPHGRCAFSPDSTSDVLIEGCYIRTGDDAIAIKAGEDEYGYGYGVGSHNITVRDCVLSSPCAAFAIGSEMSGGVSHVRVSNCRMWDSTAAVHIKSGPGRGGFVRDVVLEQLQFDGASEGFMIDLVSTHTSGLSRSVTALPSDADRCCQQDTNSHVPDDPTHHLNLSAMPQLRDIAARHVTGTGSRLVANMHGLPACEVLNVTFDAIHFDSGNWSCSAVRGTFHDTVPTPCSDIAPTARHQ